MRGSRYASTSGDSSALRSRTPSRSVGVRQRPKTGRCPAIIGKGTCSQEGARNTHVVATLVERSCRFVMVVGVRGKDTESVVAEALSNQIRRLPEAMTDTLTWDRGTEMADHKKFTVATDVVAVYFCDPKSPWGSVPRTRTPTGCCDSTSAQRDRPLGTQPQGPRCDSAKAKHPPPQQDPRLPHPG